MIFNQFTNMKKISNISAAALFAFTAGNSSAGTLNISDIPLFLGGAVDPNIMFILDDSGSMHWEHMPSNDSDNYYMYPPNSRGVYRGSGGDTGDYNNRSPRFDAVGNGPAEFLWSVRARSSHINRLYYDPERRYIPWAMADGTSMPNANINCALHNAFEPDADNDGTSNETPGATSGVSDDCRDLTRNNRERADWVTANNTRANATRTFYPAVYYRFNGTDVNNRFHYEKVEISSGNLYPPTGNKGVNRTDCVANATKCTYAEEIQNFANWYSYYRSRILIARAGIGRGFADQGDAMRVGFASINTGTTTVDSVSGRAVIRGVRKFTGTDRTAWFDALYGHRMPRQGTPLRTALQAVGEYYKRNDNNGPWSESPGANSPNPHLTCRQSYSVLMSDGYWNQVSPGVGDSDGTAGSTLTNDLDGSTYTYTPGPPYDDDPNTWSNTLADVAMEYWKTDLRPLLNNEIVPNPEDEAFWQHMVTYTVGLGVTGSLNPVTTQAAITAGTDPGWPQPSANSINNIDDMWHAAVNSRGTFFSASDPETFATSLAAILNNLISRTSSAASVALNSGALFSGSTLYQARFDTGTWTGQLLAQLITVTYEDSNSDGIPDDFDNDGKPDKVDDVNLTVQWDAGSLVPAAGARNIVTYDGSTGQPFQWTSISATQKAALGGSSAMLDYLRGDDTNETANGGSYRNRTKLLGDIINSAPIFADPPSESYPTNFGAGAPENSVSYTTFKETYKNRPSVIYVGANDGMLHAFDSATGVELMAYVPNTLMSKLPELAAPSYRHKYFVDGSPNIKDVFFDSSSAWKTVLISGLRAGGQGVFALDITNAPASGDAESTTAGKVLWEISDSTTGFSNMGYTFGRPNLVRTHNGKWVAIFGNGYNNTEDDDNDGGTTNDSTTGDASLYIVDLQTGALVKEISTLEGMADDPTGSGRPNGLGVVTPVDVDRDSIVDYVYAGDLFGNIWKFDLTSSNTSNWDVAYKSGSPAVPTPVFTALADQTDSTTAQPITSRVEVTENDEVGYMIYFGTGKYIESGDNERSGQNNQSLYAIWDRSVDINSDGVIDLLYFDRDDLLKQEIIAEESIIAGGQTTEYRITSDNSILYHTDNTLATLYSPPSSAPDAEATTPTGISKPTHLGWYIDLVNTEAGNTNNFGEKIVSDPVIRSGRIVVNTLIPSKDACDFGGTGWKLEFDVDSGAPRVETPFDVNDDGSYSLADYVYVDADGDGNADDVNGDGVVDSNDKVIVSGKKSKVGIIPTPTFLSDFKNDREFQFDSGSTGQIDVTNQQLALAGGRQSWIELFR